MNSLEVELQSQVLRIVEEFHPIRITLFGSHATGTATAASDVDLLITMQTSLRTVRQAFEIRRRISFPFPVDLIVRTPNQLAERHRMGDPFFHEILATGRVLYEAA